MPSPALVPLELALREPGTPQQQGRDRLFNRAFYALQLAGLVGAVLMLLTATIWRKVTRRNASWVSFMVTWIISCSSYLLLIGEPLNATPPHALCLIQAGLVYSVPPLTSGATLALVIHVWMTLRSLLDIQTNHNQSTVKAALVIGPYIPAQAMFAFTLRMGLSNPSLVYRPETGAYCDLDSTMPARVSATVVAVLSTLCLGVEIFIFRTLRRAWATLQRDDRGSVSIMIRVLAFTLVGMLSIILSLVLLALPYDHGGAFNIVIATIPVSSVIIFGTQKDILTAWASVFRLRFRNRVHSDTWKALTPNERQQTLHPRPRASQIR